MSIRRSDGILYVKGAVEILLARSIAGGEGAAEANAAMARRGLRVLAVATGAGPEEEDLRLIGLVGLADPPRSEAIDAIARARAAGIKTIMITGDHPTLVFSEVLRVFAARSPVRIFWEVGAFTNFKLLAVAVISLALQVGLLGMPATREAFGVAVFTPGDVALALALGLVPVTAWELTKLVSRRWRGGHRPGAADAGDSKLQRRHSPCSSEKS